MTILVLMDAAAPTRKCLRFGTWFPAPCSGGATAGCLDNCPTASNPGQADLDDDGQGDACEPCPNEPDDDIDGDGVCGDVDNCPNDNNADQEDVDTDGLGDACDDCPTDPENDADADDLCSDADNCPFDWNPAQTDGDSDGSGDACDCELNDPTTFPDAPETNDGMDNQCKVVRRLLVVGLTRRFKPLQNARLPAAEGCRAKSSRRFIPELCGQKS